MGETLENLRSSSLEAFMATVRDKLERLESLRLDKKESYLFRKKVAVPVAALLTPVLGYIDYFLLMWQRGSDDGFVGVTVIVFGALYGWVTNPKRQYAKEYKKQILPGLAKSLGLHYDSKKSISMAMMKPSKIVPSHDRYTVDDYFEGSYKDVDLRFADIHLEEKRRSNKRTYYATVFKGLAVLLEMDRKKFRGHTIMLEDQKKLFEWFKEKSSNLDRAHLVDPEFEKEFDVYTNDQVEARYLIDPVMIEELKTLKGEYEGNKMLAAFYEGKLLIMIASKHNHFEPAGFFTKATDPESVGRMRGEIVEILEIIDRLDLYDPLAIQQEDLPVSTLS